jgi:hypothetical protein
MRKWNAILSVSIVAVLLIPVMIAGSVASACCGVQPTGLTVTDSPDPVCFPSSVKVTISGEYTVIQIYSVIDPYDTGVDLKVWDPSGALIVNKTLTLATGQTTAPKTFKFSDVVVVDKLGVYKYEVIAWSKTIWGREDSSIVAGTITDQKCMLPIDIKPTSCPNPLNVGSKGVLPVAILGTPKFDVNTVIAEKVRLVLPKGEFVLPERYAFEDVATPQPPPITGCDTCSTAGPDGLMDLTLKFNLEEVVAKLGDVEDGQCFKIELFVPTTQAPRWGVDFVVIVDKGK